jgi:hypothetical protein
VPTTAASVAAAVPTAVVVVQTVAAAAVSTPAAAVAATSAPSSSKVSANSASIEDLQRAFEAAGIPNAARWAREVDEYRPYDTADPNFGKLRRELAKYNPAAGVVDRIIATLSLS